MLDHLRKICSRCQICQICPTVAVAPFLHKLGRGVKLSTSLANMHMKESVSVSEMHQP